MNYKKGFLLAGLVACFVSSAAQAAISIVYTNVDDITSFGPVGPNPGTSGAIFLDLGAGGGSGAAKDWAVDVPNYDVVIGSGGISGRDFGGGNNYQILMDDIGSGRAMNVPAGFLLQHMGERWGNSLNFDAIPAGSTGYFGIRASNTAMSGSTNPADFSYIYGWASFTRQSSGQITVFDMAYALNGAPIVTGAGVVAVPEPAGFASLAGLGALGLAAMRRRRSSR